MYKMEETTIKIRNPFLAIVWSLGLFVLMHFWQYLGSLIASCMSGATFESVISGKFNSSLTIFVMGFVAAFIGIPLLIVIMKLLWRRSFSWMRFQLNSRHFLKGLLGGFLLPVVILLIIIVSGNGAIRRFPARFPALSSMAILFGSLGLTLFTAISEEVVFRAMIVREIAAKWNWFAASLWGGIVFGFMHLLSILNKITIVSALWILLASVIASLLFTAMYVRYQSLWVPIGFHMGWNFCLKAIVGAAMSGKESTFGMFNSDLSGNAFISGGQFGIEASIVTMLFYAIFAFLLIHKIGCRTFFLLNEKIH
jgi:membrane protease YdiL (CAAX protease family)